MSDADLSLSGVRADTAHALLHRAARAQADGRTPSAASGVVRDGRLVWSAGRGDVDGSVPTPDTQYRIGSITKSFTAVLVLRLRDEGRLALDDRLEQHVPDTGLGGCTLRALLSHTAGIAAEPPGPWWERSPGARWPELASTLTGDRVLDGLDGRFHYSNVGFGLLGRVVERHRDSSWYDALRAEVLDPLGMRRTTYHAEPPHARGFAVHPWADLVLPEPAQDTLAMAPAGELWSTIEDLASWVAFLAGNTAGVISEGTLAEMRAVRVVADGREWAAAYGLGLQILRIGGREYVGHGGSMPGFLAMIVVDLERRTGAIEMTNTTSGYPLAPHESLEILEQHEPAIAPTWHPAESVPAGFLELLGLWHWGSAPSTLRLRADRALELAPVAGHGRTSTFRQVGDHWLGQDGYFEGEILRPVVRDDGSVSHLDIATFVFTRAPYGGDDPIPGGVDPGGWRPVQRPG